MHTGRRPCEVEGRVKGDESMIQGRLQIAHKPAKAGGWGGG